MGGRRARGAGLRSDDEDDDDDEDDARAEAWRRQREGRIGRFEASLPPIAVGRCMPKSCSRLTIRVDLYMDYNRLVSYSSIAWQLTVMNGFVVGGERARDKALWCMSS